MDSTNNTHGGENRSRRNLLKKLGTAAGTAAATAVAGCSSDSNSRETITETPTETTTPSPTATEVEIPDVYQLDFQFEKNQEKRNKLREVTQDGFLKNNILNTSDSRIVQNHNTEQQYDDQGIDLTALQLHHQNNWKATEFTKNVVDAIENPNQYSNVTKNGDYIPYLNGSFDQQRLNEAEKIEDVYLSVFPLIGNFEYEEKDRYLYSTRDTNYAAILQEATDRHAPIDGHIWAYKTGFGDHGFMTGYDNENDKIITMDTVKDSPIPDASWTEPKQIEQSPYTQSNTKWHPVQFARQEYNEDFQKAKMDTAKMINTIATSYQDNGPGDVPAANAVMTTGLTKDLAGAIGNYHQNNYDFNIDIKNPALTLESLRRTEGQFILDEANYEEDSITLETYDISEYEGLDHLMDEIWRDEEGTYDNFGEIVGEYRSGGYKTLTDAAKALEA